MNENVAPPAGYNPMRYDCAEGCFNKKFRPKIEVFADCFPRKISFGDIDGMVEINSAFLLMEWKSDGGTLPHGQERAFIAFSKFESCAVLIVHGNPETMVVDGYSLCWKGEHRKYQEASLDDLKKVIQRWVQHVEGFF